MPSQAQPGQATSIPVIDQYFRGHERLRIARDLAMGDLSHRELARRLSRKAGQPNLITLKDIAEWADAHQEEIAQAQQFLLGKLAEETAGLWITSKANRLAEYQDQIEEIRAFLTELRQSGTAWSRSHKDMINTYLSLFRMTADELGAYPQRASAPARTGQTVHYVIETDDTRALQ